MYLLSYQRTPLILFQSVSISEGGGSSEPNEHPSWIRSWSNVLCFPGRRWAGGSGVRTPQPRPRPFVGSSEIRWVFFEGRGCGRVMRANTSPHCSTVSAIAELLVSLWYSPVWELWKNNWGVGKYRARRRRLGEKVTPPQLGWALGRGLFF